MKRKVLLLLVSVLLIGSLAGCKSTLKEGLDKEAYQNARHEIVLADCFSEEEGYHFPEVAWKASYSEFQSTTYYSLDDVYATYVDGSATYQSSLLSFYYQDRECDDFLVTFSADSELMSVIFMYTPDDSVNATTRQAAVFSAYYEEITSLFGKEDDVKKESQDTDSGTTADEYTYRWCYETASGLKTELQLSEIFISYTEEPDYVSLSLMVDPEE